MKVVVQEQIRNLISLFPDREEKDGITRVYVNVLERKVVGNLLLLACDETGLNNLKSLVKLETSNPVFNTASFCYQFRNLNTDVNEVDNYFKSTFENYRTLFNSIVDELQYNRDNCHWEVRNYNYNWRVIISQIELKANQYISFFDDLGNYAITLIEVDKECKELSKFLLNLLMLRSLVRDIKEIIFDGNSTIKSVEDVLLSSGCSTHKFPVLSLLNYTINYLHPIKRSNVQWIRLVRLQLSPDPAKYYDNALSTLVCPNNKDYQDGTSRMESFKNSHIHMDSKIKGKYLIEKIKWALVPLEQKYRYPFHSSTLADLFINSLVNALRQEYTRVYVECEDSKLKYIEFVKLILEDCERTKSYLIDIIRPLRITTYDKSYLRNLKDKYNIDKFWPISDSYFYHDFHHVAYVDCQLHNLKRVIKVIKIFLAKPKPSSIKFNVSGVERCFVDRTQEQVLIDLHSLSICDTNNELRDSSDLSPILGYSLAVSNLGLLKSESTYACVFNNLKKLLKFEIEIDDVSLDAANEFIPAVKSYLNFNRSEDRDRNELQSSIDFCGLKIGTQLNDFLYECMGRHLSKNKRGKYTKTHIKSFAMALVNSDFNVSFTKADLVAEHLAKILGVNDWPERVTSDNKYLTERILLDFASYSE